MGSVRVRNGRTAQRNSAGAGVCAESLTHRADLAGRALEGLARRSRASSGLRPVDLRPQPERAQERPARPLSVPAWALVRSVHRPRPLSDEGFAASGPGPRDLCRATRRLDGLSTNQAERRLDCGTLGSDVGARLRYGTRASSSSPSVGGCEQRKPGGLARLRRTYHYEQATQPISAAYLCIRRKPTPRVMSLGERAHVRRGDPPSAIETCRRSAMHGNDLSCERLSSCFTPIRTIGRCRARQRASASATENVIDAFGVVTSPIRDATLLDARQVERRHVRLTSALAAEFEPARARGMAGAGRQGPEGRRLREAACSADRRGLAVQPLYTRADASKGAPRPAGRAGIPAAGTCASATPSPIPRPPTPPSWRTWRAAPPRSCCRSGAGPGRPLLRRRAARRGPEGRVPQRLHHRPGRARRTRSTRPAA